MSIWWLLLELTLSPPRTAELEHRMYLVVTALEPRTLYCFGFRVNSTEFGKRHKLTPGTSTQWEGELPDFQENVSRYLELGLCFPGV